MDKITIKKSCIERMLEEELVNDPSYELFSKILKLSNEEVLRCVEQQVKILRNSFSSIEIDRAALNNAVALISQLTRVGNFFFFFSFVCALVF